MGTPAPNPAGTLVQYWLEKWSEWEIQAVVSVSFGMQVILFFLGGIRRYRVSYVLKVLLWLVYLLADIAAIYALGHMSASLSKTSIDKHQLVAFWAPFLLLHLGGQDTITAYALEDNELWVRHLLNMFVQVSGTWYVLHKYIIADRATIVSAALLVSVAGFVKYAERIWALKCASKGSNGANMHARELGVTTCTGNHKFGNYEFIVNTAHSFQYHIFKPIIIDRNKASPGTVHMFQQLYGRIHRFELPGDKLACRKRCIKETYRVIEVQLGLAYDILYTKAQVIHTWYGYLIRGISFVSCFGALVAFTRSKRDGYSTPDTVITFVLLGGACALEVASAFKVIGSTWTYAILKKRRWISDEWHWLAVAILFARYHLIVVKDGRWSNSIGQYDLISFCDSDRTFMELLVNCCFHCFGLNLWWKKIKKSHHTKHAKLSPALKEFVWHLLNYEENGMVQIEDVAIRSGDWARRLKGLDQSEELDWSLRLEFHNCVFIWHIATSTFLSDPTVKLELVGTGMAKAEEVNTLSNYMMYLLVQHPDILPTNPNARSLFQDTFEKYRTAKRNEQRKSFRKPYQIIMGFEESRLRHDYISELRADLTSGGWDNYPGEAELVKASILVRTLLGMKLGVTRKLVIIGEVWMEMLCHAATKASGDFHARQLSNGGEFLTHILLLATYCSEMRKRAQDRYREAGAQPVEVAVPVKPTVSNGGHIELDVDTDSEQEITASH